MKIWEKVSAVFLSGTLALTGVTGAMFAPSVFAEEGALTVWDGTANTSWYDGEETEFHISTPEELAGLAKQIQSGKTMKGQTFYLDSDIILNDVSDYENWDTTAPANNWDYSVSDIKYAFAGTLKGQNHVIRGFYQNEKSGYGGLFSGIAEGGVVSDLTFENSYVDFSQAEYSTSVGSICGNNLGTIENCQVTGTVKNGYNRNGVVCGGICGASSGTIQYSSFTGTLELTVNSRSSSNDYKACIGGISGTNEELISNCAAKCTISVDDKNSSVLKRYIGGICGEIGDAEIRSCTFDGTISDSGCSGGIAGSINTSDSNAKPVIQNCTSNGKIEKGGVTGGILGACNGKNASVYIQDCRNHSMIESKSDSNYFTLAGGICGKSTYSHQITIQNCLNDGDITVTATRENDYCYLGGILGYVPSSATYANLDSCANHGELTYSLTGKCEDEYNTWRSYCGGIAGDINSCSITNCYNTGAVTSLLEDSTCVELYSGGIVGYLNDNSSEFSNLYNTGVISGDGAGISGYGAAATNSACYYSSESAVKAVGNLSADPDGIISKNNANMQKLNFVSSLGDAYVYNEGGYPLLAWESGQVVVRLDKSDIVLSEFGETETLTAKTNTTSNQVTWLSSDPKVATVEDGVVTAVGNGTAVIYAICGDTRAQCRVAVGYDYYLDQSDLSLKERKTTQLTVYSASTKSPASGVTPTWESSDEAVATVDSTGLVTAVSAGTAEITATIGALELKCYVSVKANNASSVIEKPELNNQLATITTDETLALKVSNYTGEVAWVSSDRTLAEVSEDGVVSPKEVGEVTIYAMLSGGKTLSCVIEIQREAVQLQQLK